MPHATREGRRIHYAVEGEGTALVLLPGIGSGMRLFGTLPRRFARLGLACVTFDPVGVEPSSPLPDGPWGFEAAAEDVLAVLDAHGARAAHLVGTSLGGKVALVAAASAPARVRSLTLLAGAAVLTPRARWIYRFFEVVAGRLAGEEFATVVAPFLFGRSFHAERPQVVADIVRSLRPTPATSRLMVAQARALQEFAGEAWTSRWSGPTLCVGGGEDTLTAAAEMRATAALFAAGQYLEIADAGHSLLLESARVFDAVAGFVAANP